MLNSTGVRVGLIGTGFVARLLAQSLHRFPDLTLSRVLTRRSPGECVGFSPSHLTNSIDELLEASDVVVQSCNDVFYGAIVVEAAVKAKVPVVMLDAAFQITLGAYFAGRGCVTEAEGDQPGALAALHEEALAMGFEPLAYLSVKGFLNQNPSLEEMKKWSGLQKISLPSVVAFTDGTKLQLEQALVANAVGAGIARPGLIGARVDDMGSALKLFGEASESVGRPIVDYVLSPRFPHTHGVFIVAKHEPSQRDAFQYFKMGDGPYYSVARHHIHTHIEIPKTIRRIFKDKKPFLENGRSPEFGVAAVAKLDLPSGARVERGYGGFQLRGEVVSFAENSRHLPVCLADGGVLRRSVRAGQHLTLEDIDLPDSFALRAYLETMKREPRAAPSLRNTEVRLA